MHFRRALRPLLHAASQMHILNCTWLQSRVLSTAKSRSVALFKPKIGFIIVSSYNSCGTSAGNELFIDTIQALGLIDDNYIENAKQGKR